jgi:hypothetical protein
MTHCSDTPFLFQRDNDDEDPDLIVDSDSAIDSEYEFSESEIGDICINSDKMQYEN